MNDRVLEALASVSASMREPRAWSNGLHGWNGGT
jgi:hypothetical protein